MDYQFENLNPERFQEFCQSLLLMSFPKLQCFPVAQPDGGRDAIAFHAQAPRPQFIVFQVKYVRNPQAEQDPHNWLTRTVSEEAPKLRELIPMGAIEFVLLTNIAGTAHLNAGAIDKVQKILREKITIPAQCWWRADLSRRLDTAWNLKWSYPELLTGIDMLRVAIENRGGEDNARRTRTIRAFITDQYKRETEVKFKQVELQSNLFDMFVDVPVEIDQGSSRPVYKLIRGLANDVNYEESGNTGESGVHRERRSVGAAEFLLNSGVQNTLTRIVLQGAPGHGKSTITQYICQIHRVRILEVEKDRIPKIYTITGNRIPFRVDCRDLAMWLSNRNPFSPDEDAELPVDTQRSVEAFLAAQITHFSGGAAFTVNDLHAVVEQSAVLLVFDGLDEVADIELRRLVCDQISTGTDRLQAVCVSLQTIVTSRPAAYPDSPGLLGNNFVYLELGSLTTSLIDSYVAKWIAAHRIADHEARGVRRVIQTRLSQPHLRELSRNPMQLSILLSLVHTRGVSLPDKRTSLYTSYVDLFFSREAEKSDLVRNNRELLLELHGYLAWVLHTEAETKKSRGSISEERLKVLIDDYLVREEHDRKLVSQLFSGMVERVVALVSRVEGTFEFEVQPLREYFVAWYLYTSTPYCPPGSECGGALPDRFDALARNYFWWNVTRFFAGFYDKGELPSLVERLEELAGSDGFRDTSYAQELAAALLGDWVFNQHPKMMRKTVALIVDPLGLRKVVSSRSYGPRGTAIALPLGGGREEIVEKCLEYLKTAASLDYRREVCEIVREHAEPETLQKRWLHVMSQLIEGGQDRLDAWISTGFFLGVLATLPSEELIRLASIRNWIPGVIELLVRSGRNGVFFTSLNLFKRAVDLILDGSKGVLISRRQECPLVYLSIAVNLQNYLSVFEEGKVFPSIGLSDFSANKMRVVLQSNLVPGSTSNELINSLVEFISVSQEGSGRLTGEWTSRLAPWSRIVETGRKLFGDRWAFALLALASTGIKSRDERCGHATDLHDLNVPLCERVRYARLRPAAKRWWWKQIESAPRSFDLLVALFVFSCWANEQTIAELWALFKEKVESLEPEDWQKLGYGIRRFGRDRLTRDSSRALVIAGTASARVAVCLYNRLGDSERMQLFNSCFRNYRGDDPVVLEYCQNHALRVAQEDPTEWDSLLPLISWCYSKGAIVDRFWGFSLNRGFVGLLPIDVARKIVSSPDEYPSMIVAGAERLLRNKVNSEAIPVGKVAVENRWFRQSH
jgi:hypothetical protein